MLRPWNLLLVFSLYSIDLSAQSDSSTMVVYVHSGVTANAERIWNLQSGDLDARVNASLHFKVNPFIMTGPKVDYFSFGTTDFATLGLSVRSTLVNRTSKIFLLTAIGHAWAEHQLLDGYDWGGVHTNIGLYYTTPIALQDRLHFNAGMDYILQERKYPVFLQFRDSEMLHILSAQAGLSFALSSR